MKILNYLRASFLLLILLLFMGVSCDKNEIEPPLEEDIVISDARFSFGNGIGCSNNLPGFGFRASLKIKNEHLTNLMLETQTLNEQGSLLRPLTTQPLLIRNSPVRSDNGYSYYENVDLGFNDCQSNQHFSSGRTYSVRIFVPQGPTSKQIKEVFPR